MASTDSRPTSTVALVYIVLSFSIFLLFGLMFLFAAAATLRRGRSEDGIIFLAFGVLFTAIGGGGIAWGIKWVRGSRGFAARQAAHPAEPWLWREDWVARRVADKGWFWVAFFWVLALLCNAIALPFGAFALSHDLPKHGLVLAIVLPLSGLGLIWAALYFGGRLLKFGRVWFLLGDLPFRRGGWLEGRIVVERGLRLTAPVTVGIKNVHVHRVRKPGRRRETRNEEELLWQGPPLTVSPKDFARARKSVVIPVRLALPGAGAATDIRSGTDKIEWVLAARAEVPGVNFAAEFEVPIF